MTVSDALALVANRTVSYRDAEVLLAAAMGKDRVWILAHPEQLVGSESKKTYLQFLKRREKNEPVAYIIGSKEFYGRRFSTDARALIPRPETEHLIDSALAFLPTYFKEHTKKHNKPCPVSILELGTGAGNIAVTLALELGALNIPARIIATDVSGEALTLARENFEKLSAQGNYRHVSLTFLEADMFNHDAINQGSPFDLIIANLPYVSDTWKMNPAAQPDVVFFEPDVALFGGGDGLILYREFFKHAPLYLQKGGRIMCEYGEDQTAEITPLAQEAFPQSTITVTQDYAGLDRVLEVIPE